MSFRLHPLAAAVLAALSLPVSLPAGAAGIPTLQEVVVSTVGQELTGVADSATEGSVTAKQLANRPLLRPAEVMEAVPGLIVTQHSGDGKANQYFLRGFNLDHGSDFSTQVMGMPVNMVTHAHGQGYMDLNFLIPELIGAVRYRKGVYDAEDGDLAVAGSARIDYQRRLERNLLGIDVGSHNYRRLLTAGSTTLGGDLQLLGALELGGNDGPWEQPEGLAKTNGVLRLSSGTASNGFSVTGMFYEARWKATEHVPERAIDSGEIGRYGALSPNDGGRTHRYSLSGDWARTTAEGATRANLYVIDYGLNLFSAPSGYISGLQGDQHEQADSRTVWGGQLTRSWFLGPAWKDTELTAGVQLRNDLIGNLGLYSTESRQRTATIREDRVTQRNLAFLLEARTQWTSWLRTLAGLRHDRIEANVTPLAGDFNMDNGGRISAQRNSPKAGVVFGPFNLLGPTEFYANWGQGFHSNDARGATARTNPQDGSAATPVPLIVTAKGSEVGWRATPLRGWTTSLALWQMELGSELVFIGDEGVTEPKGGSRRHGIEWSNYLTPADGWIVDFDLAWSRARFLEANLDNGGRHVPNAIPLTASLGVTADDGGKWFGGLRLRYLGSYALEETGEQKSTAFWMANLKAGYRWSSDVQFSFDVLNLFNRKANDIEYWGGACSRGEAVSGSCGGGIDGRLVHPLEPRSIRLGMRVSF